jgi:GTP-binding protein
MNSSYITSAMRSEQLPHFGAPEVAFIGRSNTGKSSLLNALLGRQNLARHSRTPGRTQMVNFFALEMGEQKLIFADLPGYGYSATSRDTRKHWESLVKAYVERDEIREFLFLIDCRRAQEPEAEDLDLIAFLSSKKPLSVVLTKSDKLNQSETSKAIQRIKTVAQERKLQIARVIAVSSLKKKGIDALRDSILAYMPGAE